MAESIQSQIDKLQSAINRLEEQRGVLGDETVNTASKTLREKLAALEEQAGQPLEGHQGQASPPAEDRRMVTILFTDMVGSTTMAEKLDPEEWRRIVAKTHSAIGDAITAHHGIIAQYLGDGLLAFFGAKEAGESDPENAIRAALDAQSAVTSLLSEDKVQVRVGIHTGLVVVGELGAEAHKEFTASGDAMNLAARLQSAAPPGGILISHDTYRYVRGVFDVTPNPPLAVKGKSEPIQTYLVRRAKPRPFRSVARGVAGVETRTVGREQEMQVLQEAYLHAYEGHGVVWAQLLGDPGVGKSRLLEDMNDWLDLRQETFRLLRARAFPDDLNQPFALIRRMWFDRFQIAEDAPLAQAETRWVERFRELSGLQDYEEPAHALGILVGLPFENSPHIGAMRSDPTQVKGRALVVSRELVKAVRRQYPVVVMLEDLQWTDQASWEYLVEVFLGAYARGGVRGIVPAGEASPPAPGRVERSVGDPAAEESTTEWQSTPKGHGGESKSKSDANGLFILGAARPDWQPPQELAELFKSSLPDEKGGEKWGELISLAPLTDQATRLLAKEIFQRVVDVPEQVLDMIVERAEGVPYYTEEIVNWLIDHGILDTESDQWRFFPEKLREQPLPATLQHLLLTRLSSLSQPERAALQRGAIFGRRFWTGGVEALGVSAGAETLGHLQPRGFVEAQPESSFQGDTEWSFHHNLLQEVTYESVLKRERLALHKVAAGWLERQARQAGRLEEFAGLLGEHCERAGDLSAAADWYLLAGKRTFSQGAPRQAKDFYTKALELLPPVDRERRWQALLGREEALVVLSEAGPWKADTTALLELARSFDDDHYLAEAYLRQAVFGWITGEAAIAHQAAKEALTIARRCGNEATEAKALALVANLDLDQGDRTASIQNIEEAVQRARHLGDESVLAFVLRRAAFYYNTIPDMARSHQLHVEQIELDHRLGNRSRETIGLGNLGSAFMNMGLYKQARALLEQARTINEDLGAHRDLAYNLGNLGETYLETGDLRKARQLLEQALKEISPSQDARGKTFILCILGMVLLAMGDASGAARRLNETRALALSRQNADDVCAANTVLAACAVMQGQLEEARKFVHEAWDYVKEHGIGGWDRPGMVYRTYAETFDALGEADNVQAVLESGHKALLEMADTINVPEWRQSFLENVPDNRALIEMWERRKQ